MKWLMDLFGGKIVEDIGKAVDVMSTTNEEKSNLKNELGKIVTTSLTALANAQRDVLVAEITGSKIQRLWRPVTMIAFVCIIVFHYALYPIATAFNPDLPILPVLESKFWTLLEIGLGGYVVGRSIEKTAETLTKNTDLSFLRKKDRRAAMKDRGVDEGED